MPLENLLKMTERQLSEEYAKAVHKGDKKRTIEINTIRIGRIIVSGIEILPPDKRKSGISYFDSNGIAYFQTDNHTLPDISTLNGFVNYMILAHISSRSPAIVDIDLLKSLIPRDIVEFKKVDKVLEIGEERVNVLNYDRMTEDIAQAHLPDVWIPNGEEELIVAVSDMPKNDSKAVLLTGLSSSVVIGNYAAKKRTFTDAFYSPNKLGATPKAIILNEIAGVSAGELEQELARQSISYEKRVNVGSFVNNLEGKEVIDLDLSTIWTAKYKEIVEDAIKDSIEREDFVPTVAKVYDVPSTISTAIDYGDGRIGLNVHYDTVITFDGKLILYSAFHNNKSDIVELFMEKGLPVEVVEGPIDLSQFEVSKKSSLEVEKRSIL